MRRLTILLFAVAAWSCASPGTPPGGPEDFDGPNILRVRPDTNAVNVRAGGVTFQFDEVVGERPQGAADLASLFLISPSQGRPGVSWRRTQISVSPPGGFRPNTTYSVTMLPGLSDLEGNVDSLGRTLVFSTGPTIARGHVRGVVFDWLAEKPAPRAFIEAFPVPTARDSARYVAVADSFGRFDLANVPPGKYLLRASIDQNKNRLLDPRELYDSATVTLTDSLRREMLTFVRDTLGPGIQNVAITDSLTLRVTMDHALDTTLVISPALFTIKQADSTAVDVKSALSLRDSDKAKEASARAKVVEDSIRAAFRADSARAADSTTKGNVRTPPGQARRTAPPPPRREVENAVNRLLGRDTVGKEVPPKPSVRAPITDIVVILDTPLKPGTSYRIRAVDMRSLLGRRRSSDRVITTPKPRKLADSTSKDSAGSRSARRAAGVAAPGADARVERPDSAAGVKALADSLRAAAQVVDSAAARGTLDSATRRTPVPAPTPSAAGVVPAGKATALPPAAPVTTPIVTPPATPTGKPAVKPPVKPAVTKSAVTPAVTKPATSTPTKPDSTKKTPSDDPAPMAR